MIIVGVFIAIAIYIAFCFFLGSLKFDRSRKKHIMIVLSVIYNFSLGFMSVLAFELIYAFFVNQPKGSGYYIPASEYSFNISLGIIGLTICLLLILPINFYFKKKSELKVRAYFGISLAVAIIGCLFYLTILRIVMI